MGTTRVRVLGPLEASRDDTALPVGGERARRILALIVARLGASIRIETLADVAWDGAPPPSWRNTLQSYLSRFRSELGLRIERRGDAYRLDESSCTVDADEFERHRRAAKARHAAGRWDDAEVHLRAGLELWRGPAFDGFTDLDVVGPLATRLEEERRTAVEALVAVQLAAGSPEAAVVTSEAVADEPAGHERLARLRATALYQAGRAAEALRGLSAYRRRLGDETGLLPSDAMTDLERMIIEGRSVSVPHPMGAPTELPPELNRLRTTPLVGRDDELHGVLRAWDPASRGECSAAFVIGEAGVGKTRLAAEIAATVSERGGNVRYGRATERLDTAHQVFAHAFRDVPAETLDAVGELQPELHSIVPHLVSLGPGQVGRDGDAARVRLHEALGRLAGAEARGCGLLLVLDDLQWASRSSIAAIEHVLTVSRPAGLMVLGVIRREHLSGVEPSVDLATDMARRIDAALVELPGLDTDAVAAVFKARDLVLDAELTRRVARATGGNALLVTELVAVTGSVDELRRDVHGDSLSVPATVATLVGDRLRRLSDEGDLLRWAALIGIEFDLSVLEAASGARHALELLEEGARVGLTGEIAAGRWEFRHGLTRDAILLNVGASRAAMCHAVIARALEAGALAGDVIGRIAYHWCEAASAGHTTEALERSVTAARHRLDQHAPVEARGHVEQALEVIRLDAHPDPVVEAELHLLDAIASGQLLDDGRRRSSAETAYATARRADADAIAVEAAIERNAFWTQGRLDRIALELLEDATPLTVNDPLRQSELLASMAGMLAVSGAPVDATGHDPVELAETALSLADELGADVAWLRAATSLVVALWSRPAAPRQIELAREMEHRAGADGPVHAARWIATPSLVLGDRGTFESATKLLRSIRDRPDLDAFRAYGYQGAGLSALLDGRYEEAQQHGAQAVGLARGHPNFTRVHAAQVYWTAAETDTLESLVPAVRAVVADNADLPAFHAMLGILLCSIEQLDEARSVLERLAVGGFETIPRDILWSATVAASAEIAATVGAVEHAEQLDRLLRPYSGQLVVVAGGAFVYGAVDRFRAMLPGMDRRTDTDVLFRRAAQTEHAMQSPPLDARTLVWQIRTGGGGDADARRRLHALCAAHDLPWAKRMLTELDGGTSDASPL